MVRPPSTATPVKDTKSSSDTSQCAWKLPSRYASLLPSCVFLCVRCVMPRWSTPSFYPSHASCFAAIYAEFPHRQHHRVLSPPFSPPP